MEVALPLEVELKYSTERSTFEEIRSDLNRKKTLGEFEIRVKSRERHLDSYFDRASRIHQNRASLRVREREGKLSKITLKLPEKIAQETAALTRKELENRGTEDAQSTLEHILQTLSELGVVAPRSDRPHVLSNGLIGSLEAAGLARLFSVTTDRETWLVLAGDTPLAELSLDDSIYNFHPEESLGVVQIEVELLSGQPESSLTEIHEFLTRNYSLRPTGSSKFERGWEFFCATQREEKMEAKLDLTTSDCYRVADWLRQASAPLPNFSVAPRDGIPSEIHDKYFDTSDYRLARNGIYLRLRTQDGQRRLVLRHLTDRVQSGLAYQEEIKSNDEIKNFSDSITAIQGHLSGLLPKRKSSLAFKEGTPVEQKLQQLGLINSLNIRINRVTWIVTEGDAKSRAAPKAGATQSERVAKIKFDKVTVALPGGDETEREYAEIELTGVEDFESSPEVLRTNQFQVFASSFSYACTDVLKLPDISAKGDAKYFRALRDFGVFGQADGPTGGAMSLVRLAPQTQPAAAARTGLLRLSVPLVTTTAGLALIPYSAGLSPLPSLLLTISAVLLVALSGIAAYRLGHDLISRGTRVLIVVMTALLLSLALVGRAGLDTTANILSIIGFPLAVAGALGYEFRKR